MTHSYRTWLHNSGSGGVRKKIQMWHDSSVTWTTHLMIWLNHVTRMTCSCDITTKQRQRRGSTRNLDATWLIRMWHKRPIHVKRLSHVTWMTRRIYSCESTLRYLDATWLIRMWHEPYVTWTTHSMTWLNHVTRMTRRFHSCESIIHVTWMIHSNVTWR